MHRDGQHRVILHWGQRRVRGWVSSVDDAILRGIDLGCSGVQVTRLSDDRGPSSWGYYLLNGDLRGVGRNVFYREV